MTTKTRSLNAARLAKQKRRRARELEAAAALARATRAAETEAARKARHDNFMEGYYFARIAYDAALEAATGMYPAEVAEYKENNPPLTFKDYLVGTRGMSR